MALASQLAWRRLAALAYLSSSGVKTGESWLKRRKYRRNNQCQYRKKRQMAKHRRKATAKYRKRSNLWQPFAKASLAKICI
jgi:hypothetical protein